MKEVTNNEYTEGDPDLPVTFNIEIVALSYFSHLEISLMSFFFQFSGDI